MSAAQRVGDERHRFREMKCWDGPTVYEHDDIRHAVLKQGKRHFGQVFRILMENREDEPEYRTRKGRSMFQGNQAADQIARHIAIPELDDP